MSFLMCFKSRESNYSTSMGKQKMVVRVYMADAKKRSRALQTAVELLGVTSATIEGDENDRLVVVGDGVDSVTLITILRKKMKSAELISVSPVEEEKKEDESSSKIAEPVIGHHGVSMMQPYMYVVERDPFGGIF